VELRYWRRRWSNVTTVYSSSYRHYQRDPYWAPPLRIAQKDLLTQKQSFYKHGRNANFWPWTAPSVGRIAAILDRNQFARTTSVFSIFRSDRLAAVADALLAIGLGLAASARAAASAGRSTRHEL